MHRYARYREREEGEVRTFPVDRGAAESVLARARKEKRLLLRTDEANRLLEAYGIRAAKSRFVPSIDELAGVAADVGYPVVLKAVGPTLVHKSELQAVLLDGRGKGALPGGASRLAAPLPERGGARGGTPVQE